MDRDQLRAHIGRMMKEATGRNEDAKALKANFSRAGSDSPYLLDLLAFEILLKATLLIHATSAKRVHTYSELFGSLPDEVKPRILDAAKDRVRGHGDYRDLDRVLSTFERNFVKLRYPYELHEGKSEQEYRELSQNWLDDGSPLETADFQYLPFELEGLTCALRQEVKSWLAD